MKAFILSLLLLLTLYADSTVPRESYPAVDIEKILKTLTPGKRWIEHMNSDLLPFWTTDDALAGGSGNFPTYRCNNGSAFNPKEPCTELAKADRCCNCGGEGMPKCERDCYTDDYKSKIGCLVNFKREYVRAKSRQVYAYGIAYHLTGDERYLLYAREGVEFLRNNAFDHINGGVINFWEIDKQTGKRHPAPKVLERISQDMAYAVSGIGFYYYLTHDPEILDDVVALKEYIFTTYYDQSIDMLRWVKQEWNDMGELQRVEQKELVSQLDQVYGYMIWLTGALPEPLQSAWKKDLVHLATLMSEQFFSEPYGLFWGAVTSSQTKQLGRPHTDFGHSIKTLWLIYTIGKMTGDLALVKFAEPRALGIIERAYLEDGTWGLGYKQDAKSGRWVLNHNKEWWSLAELDQTTATLALVNPSLAQKLTTTYPYWFEHMVDPVNKGIWHMVYAEDNRPDPDFPKQHSWKNAFHVFEHALVGYITSQQLHGEAVELYYAYAPTPQIERIHPYLYFGKVQKMERSAFKDAALRHYRKTKVTFTDIR